MRARDVLDIIGKFSTRATTSLQTSPQSEVLTRSYGCPKWWKSQFWELGDSWLGNFGKNIIGCSPYGEPHKILLVCALCLMHKWNKNPTLSQNHYLPTYLPTDPPIKFPTYLCASFRTSQALIPSFSFPAFSLPTLLTFPLFLSKTTPCLPTYLHASLYGSFFYLLSWLSEKVKSR